MSGKLYVLISWPDGSRVISMENIKEPRKPFHLYSVGEQVLARCPGFSGLYWGVVEGISGKWHPLAWVCNVGLLRSKKEFSAERSSLATEHKGILEKKLLEDRQLLEKLSE